MQGGGDLFGMQGGVFPGVILLLSVSLVLSLPSVGFACADLSYCNARVSIPPEYMPGCEGHVRVAGGACCPAIACADAADGCYITKVELYVGGALANMYQYSGGEQYRTYRIGAVWSSTHFSNGGIVNVTCQVWDSGGHDDEDTHSTKVVNEGYVGANDVDGCGDLVWGAEAKVLVDLQCHAMNIATAGTINNNKEAILEFYVPTTSTVFYTWGHSIDCEHFGSCCRRRDGPPAEDIWFNEVQNAVQCRDQCQYPGYSLVFIDACCSAVERGGCGCWPPGEPCCTMHTAFAGSAYLGWLTITLDNERAAQFSQYVFYYLRQGLRLNEAIYWAHAAWDPDACEDGDGDAVWYICGNGDLTLTTVCGGQPGQWHRPTINEGNPGA